MQEIYRFIDDAIEADRQRYTDIADQTGIIQKHVLKSSGQRSIWLRRWNLQASPLPAT